jgi:hypothetical protein
MSDLDWEVIGWVVSIVVSVIASAVTSFLVIRFLM